MKRDDYLGTRHVTQFVQWGANIVSGNWGLEHTWKGNKTVGRLECKTLCQAYSNYFWNGESFSQTLTKLGGFSNEFRRAIVDDNHWQFDATAESVKEWGRMRKVQLCAKTLRKRAKLLNPEEADTDDLSRFGTMRATHSKIYSLLVSGLPMYDSRTACGLASLIWLFCKAKGNLPVPDPLKLGIPSPKVNFSRRPSEDFPRIYSGFKYADSNLKASWILRGLLDEARGFCQVPEERQLLALQSALFMIGYKPLKEDAIIIP